MGGNYVFLKSAKFTVLSKTGLFKVGNMELGLDVRLCVLKILSKNL